MSNRPLLIAALNRLVLPMTALLGGCATLGRLSFQEPDVRLEAIHITGLGLLGGTLDLVFDAYNPNDYRIRSTRLEAGIDLEGRHFGDALLERPLDLSPGNHSRVVVPLRFEWAGVCAGAKALLTWQAGGFRSPGWEALQQTLRDQSPPPRGHC